MMPDKAYQMPAPIETERTDGLSPVPGSRVAAPTPMPSMLRMSCVTSIATTPARTAAQETRFSRMVRASSSGVTGLMCGASASPRSRGVSGCGSAMIASDVECAPLTPHVSAGFLRLVVPQELARASWFVHTLAISDKILYQIHRVHRADLPPSDREPEASRCILKTG